MPRALVLLVLFSVLGLTGPARAEPARARALLSEKVFAVSRVQNAHLSELQVMAQLPVVRDYFLLPEKERAGRLETLQQALFLRQMGSEMCLIDANGSEVLRAVRGRMAPQAELAHDEVTAPFFQAGIRLAAGQSYTSDPYLSPDVEEWVVGYVVPVVPNQAILHFEHPIRELQAVITQAASGGQSFVLLVDSRGFIVADSRQPVSLGLIGTESEPATYFRNIRKGAGALQAELVTALKTAKHRELRVLVDGNPWDVAWRDLSGITVVAFDGH